MNKVKVKSTSKKKEDIEYVKNICKVTETDALKLLEKFDWDFKKTLDEYKKCVAEFQRLEELEREQQQSSDSETTEGSDTDDEFLDNIQQGYSQTQTKIISKRMKKDILKKLLSNQREDHVPVSANCDDPGKAYMRILSWNLCSANQDHQIERIDHIVKFINTERIDILFVQDLVKLTFDHLTKKLGGFIGFRDEMRGDEATFLKKTTVEHKDHWYARDSLTAEVIVRGCKFFLLNSHLKSNSKQRKEQLQRCFEKIVDEPPDCNIIFGGDLNIVKEDEATIPEGVSDLWIKCGGKKKDRTNKYTMDCITNTNLKDSKSRNRSDRFYFLESNVKNVIPRAFKVIDDKYGKVDGTDLFPSDHYGILATFELVGVGVSNKTTDRKRKSDVLSDSDSYNLNNSDDDDW